jgi:hypothetical protein
VIRRERGALTMPCLLLLLVGGLGCGRGTSGKSEGGGPGLFVASSAARSCDVVLKVEGDKELLVQFPDHVLGSFFQRGARVGVAVIARSDVAIGYLTKGLSGDVSIDEVQCFDRAGDPISEPSVSLK